MLKLLNAKEHGDFNAALSNATRNREPAEAVEHIYLTVLARQPTGDESADMLAHLKRLEDDRVGYTDIFWVLLNSSEFLVNH